VYGKMKGNPQYLLDALLISFISYFNLSMATLVNMKWDNFIVHITGYSDKYFIHIPRVIGNADKNNNKAIEINFELKQIRGDYAFVIRDLLKLIKKLYKTELISVDYYKVAGQNEYIPQPSGGPNLFL
jgi:hypothetical protein